MRTVRSSGRFSGGGCLLRGGLLGGSAPGVSAPGGVCSKGVSAPGGVCSGGCLLLGVSVLGGVCSGGVYSGGVSALGGLLRGVRGCVCSEGGLLWGGVCVVSQHALRQTPPPPPRGQTDPCKNITFTTSLRTVKIQQHYIRRRVELFLLENNCGVLLEIHFVQPTRLNFDNSNNNTNFYSLLTYSLLKSMSGHGNRFVTTEPEVRVLDISWWEVHEPLP